MGISGSLFFDPLRAGRLMILRSRDDKPDMRFAGTRELAEGTTAYLPDRREM
jgi:hypothetical protein